MSDLDFIFKLPPIQLPSFLHRDVTIVLLGVMANWILFGVLMVQVYLYYAAFPDDPRGLKLTVFMEILLETIQTLAVTRDGYRFFTEGFTDLLITNEIGAAWFSVPLMTGLIAFLTQGFYCYRTAIITKSKYAVGLIMTLSVCQLGASIAVSLQAREARLLTAVLGTKKSLITIGIWGTSGVACDIFIAAIMTYYLKKRDTGFKATHNMIKRLTRLSIETGSITAGFAVLTLILVYLPGHPPYYEIAALILAKTYSNSMVSAMNSRMKVVSNTGGQSPPCWNECESDKFDTSSSRTSTNRTRSGFAFHRHVDSTVSSSAFSA